jgi:hypothetical protein
MMSQLFHFPFEKWREAFHCFPPLLFELKFVIELHFNFSIVLLPILIDY